MCSGAEPGFLDDGQAIALAFLPGSCDQAAQVQVAVVVLAQQSQSVGSLCSGTLHPQITADDRLDADVHSSTIELHHRKEVAFVSQCQGRHAQLQSPTEQVGMRGMCRIHVFRFAGNADDRVHQRVFAMDVKMNKPHGYCRLW